MTWNLDESTPGSSRFGTMADKHAAPNHNAVIVTKVLEGGKVKIYEDAKGAAERTEITTPEGKVFVYKDYDTDPLLCFYKRIEILSPEGTFRESLDIEPHEKKNIHTQYTFYYQRSQIGQGYGDISLQIAHELLQGKIEPRSGIGTAISPEVIATIKKILESKNLR